MKAKQLLLGADWLPPPGAIRDIAANPHSSSPAPQETFSFPLKRSCHYIHTWSEGSILWGGRGIALDSSQVLDTSKSTAYLDFPSNFRIRVSFPCCYLVLHSSAHHSHIPQSSRFKGLVSLGISWFRKLLFGKSTKLTKQIFLKKPKQKILQKIEKFSGG
jgi:hypothetical protein